MLHNVLDMFARFDTQILDYVSSVFAHHIVFFKGVTVMCGSIGAILFIIVGYVLFRFFVSKERAYVYVSAIMVSFSLSYFLKYIFGRLRPLGYLVYESSPSFPSGHATISAAIASALVVWVIRDSRISVAVRYFVIISSVIFAFLVGLSRIVLRAHYPTDVIAGWLIGVLVVCCGERVISHLNKKG